MTRPHGPALSARGRRALPLAAALLAGLAAALGQAPWGLWPVALAGYGGLVALVAAAPGARAAAGLALLAGTAQFGLALSWIVEPFLVDPARHGWMIPFVLPLMAAGMALFWAVPAWLAARLAAGPRRAGLFAAAFVLAELARGHVLTGFPWAMAGHVWTDTPVAQLAAAGGAAGLSALTLGVAALPFLARGTRRRAALAVLGGAVLALVWTGGAWRLGQPLPAPQIVATLRLVQPNAAQHLKWDPAWARVFFERHLDLTARPAAAGTDAPDLVVWSETAVPFLLGQAPDAMAAVAAAADGVPVALGIQRAEAGRYFNALALLDEDGAVAAVYDKHHLVPFGEYVPLADWLLQSPLGGFAARQLAGYAPGPGPVLLDMGPLGQVLPLICYEAIFPRHLRGTARPDWVLQITNDAWFGQVSGPWQHLAQARLRAIEQGLPLARAANTGVSAMIDPMGRITAMLPLGVEGALDAALPPALPPTPFARFGEAPVAVLLVLAALAFGWRRRGPPQLDPGANGG